MKNCPVCKLTNPSDAFRCDCGYDFVSGEITRSNIPEDDQRAIPVPTRKARRPFFTIPSLTLWLFIVGNLLKDSISHVLAPNYNSSEDGFGLTGLGVILVWLLGTIAASIGIARHERPHYLPRLTVFLYLAPLAALIICAFALVVSHS